MRELWTPSQIYNFKKDVNIGAKRVFRFEWLQSTRDWLTQLSRKDFYIESVSCRLPVQGGLQGQFIVSPCLKYHKFHKAAQCNNPVASRCDCFFQQFWKNYGQATIEYSWSFRCIIRKLKKTEWNFNQLYQQFCFTDSMIIQFVGKVMRILFSKICYIFELNLGTRFWRIIWNPEQKTPYIYRIKSKII